MGKTKAAIKKLQMSITKSVTSKYPQYYLSGGTALAFHLKHRYSEDLDFFTQRYNRKEVDTIMRFVGDRMHLKYSLEAEQHTPGLVPMKVYYVSIGRGAILKIDFVQDPVKNIQKIRNGLHSVEDIYVRKMRIAIGEEGTKSIIGTEIATGRQSAKDVVDLYYLSKHYMPLSQFFFKRFEHNSAERLIMWYKGFNRMDLKLEMLDLETKADAGQVLTYLDNEILKELPDKLMG